MRPPWRREIWPGSSAPIMPARAGAPFAQYASEIQRSLVDGERRLARDLRQRRMRVADAGDVLARCTELHRDDAFGDELARLRADDVHPEDAIGLLICKQLDEACRIAERARPAVCRERETARAVGGAFRLQLLLRLADPRNFRRRVDDPGNRVEVDVPV